MKEAQSAQKTTGGIFYGWWIVAVCFLVLLVHSGCAFYSFSVFLDVWKAQFPASSVTAVSLPAALYMLMVGITGPVIGRLTDRYGPKRLILGGGVIAGTGLMLLSQVTEVWHLYVLYSLVGIGMSGAGFIPVSTTISNWFAKRRGMAMGITTAGIALGALLALLTDHLIESISWQAAFLVLGAITFALVIPSIALVMKTRPEDMGLLADNAAPLNQVAVAKMEAVPGAEVSFDVRPERPVVKALRSPSYWLMVAAFFFEGAAIAGILQHEDSFLGEMDLSISAALGLALTGGVGGMGKLAFGYIADRMPPKYAAILCIALQMVGLAIIAIAYIVTQNMAIAWAFVFVFGFAMGGNVTLQPLVTGQLFGTASFGTLLGGVVLAAAVGSALGPLVMGATYDASASYSTGFIAFLVVYAVAIVALSLARRPKPISPNITP